LNTPRQPHNPTCFCSATKTQDYQGMARNARCHNVTVGYLYVDLHVTGMHFYNLPTKLNKITQVKSNHLKKLFVFKVTDDFRTTYNSRNLRPRDQPLYLWIFVSLYLCILACVAALEGLGIGARINKGQRKDPCIFKIKCPRYYILCISCEHQVTLVKKKKK